VNYKQSYSTRLAKNLCGKTCDCARDEVTESQRQRVIVLSNKCSFQWCSTLAASSDVGVEKAGGGKLHFFDRQLHIADREDTGAQNFNLAHKCPWKKNFSLIFLDENFPVIKKSIKVACSWAREMKPTDERSGVVKTIDGRWRAWLSAGDAWTIGWLWRHVFSSSSSNDNSILQNS